MLLIVTSAVCAGYLSLFSLSSRNLDGCRAARQRRSVCATRPTPAAADGRGVLPGGVFGLGNRRAIAGQRLRRLIV